jgi:hypothetical protein
MRERRHAGDSHVHRLELLKFRRDRTQRVVNLQHELPLHLVQYCWSGMFIPDPRSECFPSRIRIFSRVSDPHWFNADPDPDPAPDPAIFLISDPDCGSESRIRIEDTDCGSGLRIRIPDPDLGFDDLKLKKIYRWKFNFYFLDQKLQFTSLHKGRPSYRRSLQP